MDQYLHQTGIAHLGSTLDAYARHGLVQETLTAQPDVVDSEQLPALFTYKVPIVDPSGACSREKKFAEKPFDLRTAYGISEDWPQLTTHAATKRLAAFGQLMDALQKRTGADWIGVYRNVPGSEGHRVLLKESYRGSPSRAEFPLTDEFATTSNNSTVGLTGKVVIVADVASYDGPYYQCDALVRSECCLPIFARDGTVSGIIDAEAFAANHFTPDVILALVEACIDIPHFDSLYA